MCALLENAMECLYNIMEVNITDEFKKTLKSKMHRIHRCTRGQTCVIVKRARNNLLFYSFDQTINHSILFYVLFPFFCRPFCVCLVINNLLTKTFIGLNFWSSFSKHHLWLVWEYERVSTFCRWFLVLADEIPWNVDFATSWVNYMERLCSRLFYLWTR